MSIIIRTKRGAYINLGKIHGLSSTKIYKVWKSMRVKCLSSNKDNHHKKGGQWICKEWDDPVAFVTWAEQNGYKEGLEFIRINKEDGYHPENCVFRKKEETLKTHGLRYTRIYNIWNQMIQRCTNPKLKHYERYGGRGIKVCEEWMSSIESFKDWAVSNGYKDCLTIDRIDVNGNYEPANCKWSTNVEQQRNKRTNRFITIKGETKTVAEWAEISGIPYKTLQRRIDNGCKEETLLAPKGYQYKQIEINGIIKPMSDWAKENGLQYSTIQRRYDRGIRGVELLRKKKNANQLTFDIN